ncbi:hypothetical protein I9018_13420 [Pseudomonas sp. MPFS]|uniref:tautomerase family protein n=1 Tax=Pseudomonas sp. MPFS TaxID=2795724 RepID=UPI001F147CDC|nr:hypothetical protein [Pseudomonas sp. MPFS]UMZ14626.1 hypothetical protein I9018_13420 [Pseudomonas sp. MPFS]
MRVAILPLPRRGRQRQDAGLSITEGTMSMPMIDAYIPAGALHPEAEARLVRELTDLLIEAEGFALDNPLVQGVSVVFLHRPAAVFVAGAPSPEPRYRVVPSVPEGKYCDEAVKTLVRAVTEAFARAEGSPFEEIAPRVWVFPTEIAEGRWGSRGVIRGVADIHAMLVGEHEREVAERQLAQRRRSKALELLGNVAPPVGLWPGP